MKEVNNVKREIVRAFNQTLERPGQKARGVYFDFKTPYISESGSLQASMYPLGGFSPCIWAPGMHARGTNTFIERSVTAKT